MTLETPLRKSDLGQKKISFVGDSVWNKLNNDLKILNTAHLFTHSYENFLLKNLSNEIMILIKTCAFLFL